MTFLWPLVFVLLPLPWLVRRISKPMQASANGALRVPFFQVLQQGAGGTPIARRLPASWQHLLAGIIWLCLLTALARPAFVGKEIPLPADGRDIMLAIDLSGSMEQPDFMADGQQTTRLNVVKATADEFISRRRGDRVGLILFSNRAYLQAPLTFDRQAVSQLLTQAEVGLTGRKTAIGDAIAIAVKRLQETPQNTSQAGGNVSNNISNDVNKNVSNNVNSDENKAISKVSSDKDSRVLILLTDGASNAGSIQPMEAAKIASQLGIRIYTIGVGSGQMVINTPFGQQLMNMPQDLDEGTLKKIADMSNGRYFRAADTQSLEAIYQAIDMLEPAAGEPIYLRPTTELYMLPASVALLLTGLWAVFYAWQRLSRVTQTKITSKSKVGD